MTDFKMGDKVLVESVALPDYDANNIRKWIQRKLDKEVEAYYVGFSYKQEGKYSPPTNYSSYGYESYGGFEPGYLKVTNTIKLLRIKFRENGNDRFVFPEDIRKQIN